MSPEQLLGQLESEERVIIADMEAGIGTLTRMRENSLDLVLLVVNPSEKSLEVARRGREVIAERKIASRCIVIANRLQSEDDLKLVRAALDTSELATIPEDAEVGHADICGRSPVDSMSSSPAVEAVMVIARSLIVND